MSTRVLLRHLVRVSAGVVLATACTRAPAPESAETAVSEGAEVPAPEGAGTPTPENAAAVAGPGLPAGAFSYVYRCDEGYAFSVHVDVDSVILNLMGRVIELPKVEAASGARYSDGEFTFWSRGDRATLETPTARYQDCPGQAASSPWEDARLRGVDYRGIGQEPGWYVEIDEDRSVLLVRNYGESRVVTPAPVVSRDPAAGRTTYRATTEAADLLITVDETPCSDVMSGEAFTTRATASANGTDYDGCGRWLR